MGRKTKAGSGKKVFVTTIRLSESEIRALDAIAKALNMTRSDAIRTLVLEKLVELTKPEPRK